MQNPEIYRDASAKFMEQAHTELAAGDLAQASEKGWAAAAQMTKAIAAQRELPHTVHWHLQRVIDRLVDETGDAELATLFRAANTLHINFYENTGSAVSVAEGLQDVARLLDKLSPILRIGRNALAEWLLMADNQDRNPMEAGRCKTWKSPENPVSSSWSRPALSWRPAIWRRRRKRAGQRRRRW